ncbi:PREDICTED: leucine-rich repeat extensin-like protein 2 [Prunus mume]|uniref:Leucine-rich repeat extensin-like protein 2 n=1 Tax=Prunus mume TaxID=102107 RepID=A0ABM0PT67_PRUMU|nr:PREDICTED: leucine-rich repeat extensin-like protein 2 [Prunus mume]
MASAELSKLCICIVKFLSLAIHAMSSQTQSQPTITNDVMPTDEQLISLAASYPSPSPYPENPASESGGYVVTSPEPDSYKPPPPPPQEPYFEALSPETQDDQLLPPDYSPSPAPSLQEYLGASDQITDYPSPPPPPYIEVEAPEGYYETYSPVQSPAPAHSSKPGSNALPFNYKADYESEFDAQVFNDSDESKNRETMVGFVLGAVCLVGLAGLVYKKEKKYSKAKAEYEYELTKREDA